jgi:glycosyltransferase involved in cell wall biosynthesis
MTSIVKEFTGERPTILTAATHERYQSYMDDLPFKFILWDYPGSRKWDFNYAPLPANHEMVTSLTPDIRIDAVLSQHKTGQHQVFSVVAQQLNIPLIQLEHTLPLSDRHFQLNALYGDKNVFLSQYSANRWQFPMQYDIIPQCVDTDLFENRNKVSKSLSVLSVVNEFDTREGPCNYSGWKKITRGISYKLVGRSNNDISQPAANVDELVDIYNDHAVFLNTSRASTMPFALFEAMSCGCCCISSDTSMIPEVINHGENGFLYDVKDNDAGRKLLQNVLSMDRKDLTEIGRRARQTVLEKFSKAKFTENWTNLINEVI